MIITCISPPRGSAGQCATENAVLAEILGEMRRLTPEKNHCRGSYASKKVHQRITTNDFNSLIKISYINSNSMQHVFPLLFS